MIKPLEILNFNSTIELDPELQTQGLSYNLENAPADLQIQDLKKMALEHDLTFVGGQDCLKAKSIIQHRSVSSHFLDYIDCIETIDGKLWGDSIFTHVFQSCLLLARQNQDYKGSVIFLGESPRVLPAIDILAKFGFVDFDFLQVSEALAVFDHVKKQVASLFDTRAAIVDSASFVRSPKEYSLCFVMDDHYSEQTLEDMSYFHFLSNSSLVFDFSGRSNFMFKEVKALGVNVFDFEQLNQLQKQKVAEKLAACAQKVSD